MKEKLAKKRSERFCFSIPTVIIMSSSILSNNGSDDNSSTGAGKKAKKLDPPGRDGDGADFDAVRTAVLSLSASLARGRDNPAVRAALEGLDRELSRRRRDEALRAKFLSESGAGGAAAAGRLQREGGGEGEGLSPAEIVMVDASDTGIPAPPPSSPAAADPRMEEDGEEEDWHEVQENSGSEHPNVPGGAGGDPQPHASSSSSYPAGGSLGAELAREAISAVALFEVRVRSPVQAAAAALHAALRGPRLGFACTGVPDPGSKSAAGGGAGTGGGFAPPVRELPKTHFLPHGWNSDPNRVAIRYRKAGVGSAILLVRSEAAAAWGADGGGGDEDTLASISPDRDWIKVSLVPNAATIAEAEAAEGPPPLVFAAGEHVNLSSLRLALASSSLQEQQSSGGGRGGGGAGTGGVAPALHYKRLPALLSRFAEAFDLGGTAEDGGTAAAAAGLGAPAAGGEAGTPLPYVDATVLRLPAHAAAVAGRLSYPAAPAWGGPPAPIPHLLIPRRTPTKAGRRPSTRPFPDCNSRARIAGTFRKTCGLEALGEEASVASGPRRPRGWEGTSWAPTTRSLPALELAGAGSRASVRARALGCGRASIRWGARPAGPRTWTGTAAPALPLRGRRATRAATSATPTRTT
jgi:hypothetical protein